MKIIHSFWSKPTLHKQKQEFSNNRKFGGWLEYKYFLMSNCLSLLTLKRENSNVDLYTDDHGYDILINQLGLPYGDVSLILNELENEDHRLWILGKIKVIELQEKPFIHVDNDVFTWAPFPKSNLNDHLIVQSKHPVPDIYKTALMEVQQKLKSIPSHLKKNVNEYLFNANVGIVGGNDIEFFQNWCKMAKKFLKENMNQIINLENIGYFNQIIEEFSISCMLSERKNVTYLIDCSKDINDLDSVLRFHFIPFIDKYIHLVGIAKHNKIACNQLELRLKYEFPEYHKKVMDIMDSMDYEDSSSTYERMKSDRIFKALPKVYHYKYEEIKTIKIKLYDNFSIHEEGDEENFFLIEIDPFSGKEIQKILLEGTDQLMYYFTESLSINELIEIIRGDFQNINEIEFKQLEENILSMVFEEILMIGSLEIL
ncbi:hypothetical protein IRZ71_20645 [Flavobacterium sp. ANB]|uniref:DUF6734 family protein n=1 Tax=unclassified Flavobacterium TaxID=196869 RepID=UPI0012B84EA5|nr:MULTISPECIES: DUF6734 family protein [unclassified Flavobacterium]MBF4518771.1 hypothetical protein [Flavobacterium sp. ANB]MTD71516.1 hypothetical protein [Flavobacterium sp. LC2016-13]